MSSLPSRCCPNPKSKPAPSISVDVPVFALMPLLAPLRQISSTRVWDKSNLVVTVRRCPLTLKKLARLIGHVDNVLFRQIIKRAYSFSGSFYPNFTNLVSSLYHRRWRHINRPSPVVSEMSATWLAPMAAKRVGVRESKDNSFSFRTQR